MQPMTLAQLAEVVDGRLDEVLDPAAVVDGPLVVDSRQVVPGALFVAFEGEHVDGHDFAAAAVAAGAAGVPGSRPCGAPAVLVDDAMEALAKLTRWQSARMTGVTRIGVTGSSGKTSTKDLFAQTLSRAGATHATAGSQNNEIGVPMTVAACPPDTKFLILEMGARGAGHLTYLTDMVPLHVAVVLNVGAAHADEFGSKEDTAKAKGELVASLAADGLAVLNADDPLAAPMAARSAAPVLLFGRTEAAQIRATDVTIDTDGRARFMLTTPAGQAPVALRLLGEHHVSNALAVAAVAHHIGMAPAEIATALGNAVAATDSRMQRHDRPDGVTVIDDACNANPDSTAAALRALAAMCGERRTLAVIGEMRELGAAAVAEHRAIGALAAELGTSVVVAVGDQDAAAVAAGAEDGGAETHLVPDRAAAAGLLEKLLHPGDLVIVKASLSAGLQALVKDLLAT
ncbi:UDP-N-acetylmuramoyl-tripeptide--D-alanyl-D-alanine ligase [Streptomyces sp. NRRL B-24484]|uniref:UDP-N-acetylmuramoyl-tripeptide--D-alanyl-D- alanine ligase n=1 Tax=Streptomyces sp. NRRL B-24484 TaxID=1463833 RepID=UPI0004C07C52|nr:UDP-N-acetylmuramoyl-tripeptide--D-alanyl-D-alanine ligase [Streptomyces sp. NRRL B-24484]